MITSFKQKEYSGKSSTFQKIVAGVKGNPLATASLGIGSASLAVSSANLKNNRKNRIEGTRDRQEQIKVMKHLNKTLTKVDSNLLNKQLSEEPPVFQETEKPKSVFPLFRNKTYSYIADNALKGAAFGSLLSTAPLTLSSNGKRNILGNLGKKMGIKDVGQFNSKSNNNDKDHAWDQYKEDKQDIINKNRLLLVGGSMLVGAALGALVGGVRDFLDWKQKKSVGSTRMSDRIIDNLVRMGYKGGKDFTMNSKLANSLKLKVCVSVSRVNGEVKLVVNTANDSNLQKITSDITKNLPKSAVATETIGDKFNNLVITKMSSVEDPAFVSSILEQFIRKGYPVYIVEIG